MSVQTSRRQSKRKQARKVYAGMMKVNSIGSTCPILLSNKVPSTERQLQTKEEGQLSHQGWPIPVCTLLQSTRHRRSPPSFIHPSMQDILLLFNKQYSLSFNKSTHAGLLLFNSITLFNYYKCTIHAKRTIHFTHGKLALRLLGQTAFSVSFQLSCCSQASKLATTITQFGASCTLVSNVISTR